MEIVIAKSLPSTSEVAETLKREFSSHYSYNLSLEDNSIFVGKSTWVGANIFIYENQITIAATSQSIIEDIIVGLCMTELGLFLIPLFYYKGAQILSQWTQFEKEICYFLEHKYKHQHVRVE